MSSSGPDATSNIDTYNDTVNGDQTNQHYTENKGPDNSVTNASMTNKFWNGITSLVGFAGISATGNSKTVYNLYGGNTTNTSVANSNQNINDRSSHQNFFNSVQDSPSSMVPRDVPTSLKNEIRSQDLPSLVSSRRATSPGPSKADVSENPSKTPDFTNGSQFVPSGLFPLRSQIPGDKSLPPHKEPVPSGSSEGEILGPSVPQKIDTSRSAEDPSDSQFLELARHMNDKIEKVVQRLVAWFPPEMLTYDLPVAERVLFAPHPSRPPNRQNPIVAEFVSSKINEDAQVSDVILPCMLYLFHAKLYERVFKPFAVGLDETRNNVLLETYSGITGTRPTSLESITSWRSITYSYWKSRIDDRAYARRTSKEFLRAVLDFVPTLLPPEVSIKLPDIFTEFEDMVTTTISRAIELQDYIQTGNKRRVYRVYDVKVGDEFDPDSSESHTPLISARSGPGAHSPRVLGYTRLGFGVMPLGVTEKGGLEILLKVKVLLAEA